MSSRDVPPPRESSTCAAPRRPSLAKAGVLDARVAQRDIVNAWCDRRRVSDRDRAALLAAPVSRVDELKAGRASHPLDLLFLLPERDALDLLDDLREAVRAAGRGRRSA